MLKKVINFDADEISLYESIRRNNSTPDAANARNNFKSQVGKECYNLSFIYPVVLDTNEGDLLAKKLMNIQNEIKKVIGDDHFYSTAKDLHMTFLAHTDKTTSLPEATQQEYRKMAEKVILDEENLFRKQEIHFFGGCSTRDAVIIHGYDFAELNKSRLATVFHSMRNGFFDEDMKLRYGNQIEKNMMISPNIAHMSLIYFKNYVGLEERQKINELLSGQDFGKTIFSEVGLYEFFGFDGFSKGLPILSRRFSRP